MARTRKPSPMRAAIIKAASELFFDKGFSKTTSSEVCKKADVGTGNLTFYFPTKEHILAVLVEMMCDYQWKEMENAADEGKSSLLAYCLELTTLVAIGEEIPQMQDFLMAAYTHPMTLDFIRANDKEKIKRVFEQYTNEWDEERFTETEAIVSGIEYATIMTREERTPLPLQIEGGLDAIMTLYGVPEETRRKTIREVLDMDYRALGRRILSEFKEYIEKTNEAALKQAKSRQKKRPSPGF